ncbi:ZN300 protein, partial [Mionectes macconnelli]|nr:ZN300 protein [Mionectes macconnelli]
CWEAGWNFSQDSELVVQEQLPSGEKPFLCLECRKSSCWRSHLLRHWQIHTREQP